MKFRMLAIACCWIASGTIVFSQPAGYYADAEGLTGEDLRIALHGIIDDHTVLSYSALWSAFIDTDQRSDGYVWDMYSDVPGGTPPYYYSFGSDQCGNYGGEGDCYNREHSFPKSWFGDQSPMNTDLFHLYPTDGYVNGKRGNYPFGETEAPSWTSLNGSKVGPCSVEGYNGTVFEPIDEYKGDFARTYFYMSVRYFEEDSNWPGSPMVDGATIKPWAKAMLIKWHQDDPVSSKEINRNEEIYSYQGNRNPFIDRPEYTSLVFGGENQDQLPPSVDSIVTISSEEIEVWFNEPLDYASATESAHYLISGGVAVTAANYAEGSRQVNLVLSGIENGTYSLIISGISDVSGNIQSYSFFAFEVLLSSVNHPDIVLREPYPNPSDGAFFVPVQGNAFSDFKLILTDISGREIPTQQIRVNRGIKVRANPTPGLYLLQVIPHGLTASGMIVIQ